MAFRDLPQDLASDDRSLSAVVPVTVEGNLDQCYQQSCWGLGVAGGATGWAYAIYAADEWEYINTGLNAWPGMPVPLRSKRDGTWRGITIRARAKANYAAKLRAYLLGSPAVNHAAVRADPEGFTGVDSYAEADLPGDGAYHDYEFVIAPGDCEVRAGDGTVSGIALPVAWLHWIVQSTNVDCEITIRAPSPEETL